MGGKTQGEEDTTDPNTILTKLRDQNSICLSSEGKKVDTR